MFEYFDVGVDELRPETLDYLLILKNGILNSLYNKHLSSDYSSITLYDEITDFINNIAQAHMEDENE